MNCQFENGFQLARNSNQKVFSDNYLRLPVDGENCDRIRIPGIRHASCF